MTVLFVVLALSDFTKALQFAHDPTVGGLVVFGHKFHGVGHNLILGPLFGIVFLTYAYGLWKLRAWTLPLAIVYAFYVPYNLVLFWYRQAAGTAADSVHRDLSRDRANRFGRHRNLSRLQPRAPELKVDANVAWVLNRNQYENL